jgi:hypothetical protein
MLQVDDLAWFYSGGGRKYIHLGECASERERERERDSTKLDMGKKYVQFLNYNLRPDL